MKKYLLLSLFLVFAECDIEPYKVYELLSSNSTKICVRYTNKPEWTQKINETVLYCTTSSAAECFNNEFVLYKSPKILSIGSFSKCKGGAHPVGGEYGITLDMTSPSELKLQDIFRKNHEEKFLLIMQRHLAQYLEQYYEEHEYANNLGRARDIMGVPDNPPIVKAKNVYEWMQFDSETPITLKDMYPDNFAIIGHGILFYYNQCHFCCAVGTIRIYVPYKELKRILKWSVRIAMIEHETDPQWYLSRADRYYDKEDIMIAEVLYNLALIHPKTTKNQKVKALGALIVINNKWGNAKWYKNKFKKLNPGIKAPDIKE